MQFEGGEGGEDEDTLGEYIGERNLMKERHGFGWAYLPNGDVYQGQYRRGQRHGDGLYVFRNGARYRGQYRCGVKRGQGTMHYPDGSRYGGEWRKDLQHGHGTYTYVNGDRYEGSWFKGQRHGIGTYTYAEACCAFNGTWQRGVRLGAAEVIFRRHRFHCTWAGEDAYGPAAYTFACKTMALGWVQMEMPPALVDPAGGGAEEAEAAVETGAGGEPVGVKPPNRTGELRNEPGERRICEPVWKLQHIDKYDYSRLPPEPMPLPLGDSEDDECDVTPAESEDELIYFAKAGEEDEEALDELEGEEEDMAVE